MKRPKPMTTQKQMEQHVPEEAIIRHPSIKSWIAVGVLWTVSLCLVVIYLLIAHA